MKETAKEKIIKELGQYVQKKIIRTGPTYYEDRQFITTPILLLGFTDDGRIRYLYADEIERKIFGITERVLSEDFTDSKWIEYDKIKEPNNNPLNEWKDKLIMRIRPTRRRDCSCMCKATMEKPKTMYVASEYHLIVISNEPGEEGEEMIYSSDFLNPKDWVLA